MLGLSAIYQYLDNAQDHDLGKEIEKAAKRAIIDTFAVTIAGKNTSPLPEITKKLSDQHAHSTIIGKKGGYESSTAAFYNGISAHVLDMDDCDPYLGHPSAVLIPAILALGEQLNSNGKDFLKAYASSYFASWALGKQCCYDISAHGWHATSVIMTLGASWSCGFLKRFSAKQFADVTSIAVSFSGGVRGNFGTPVKPVHVGMAARNGV